MKIYYTVSSGEDSPSNRPSNSIGGYKSSTMVPNDFYNSVFGQISILGLSRGGDEYIGLMILNEEDSNLSNLKFWFKDFDNKQSSLEFAAVKPSIDSNGYQFIERLATINSKPQNIIFSHPTEDNPAILGELKSGEMLGFWLHRKIDKESSLEDYDNVAQRDPNNWHRFIPIKKGDFEGSELIFEWD